jgi:hypothetical protein
VRETSPSNSTYQRPARLTKRKYPCLEWKENTDLRVVLMPSVANLRSGDAEGYRGSSYKPPPGSHRRAGSAPAAGGRQTFPDDPDSHGAGRRPRRAPSHRVFDRRRHTCARPGSPSTFRATRAARGPRPRGGRVDRRLHAAARRPACRSIARFDPLEPFLVP